MSENLKTIKELADEWGITKQTIQYHIKFLPTENRQKNDSGITVLTLEEQRIIKKRVKRKDKNSDNVWSSISDLMSGLMIVFLFTSVIFMSKVIDENTNIKKQQQTVENIVTTYEESKENIYEDLYNEFEGDMDNWHMEIDKDGTIRFKEPEVFFDMGESELKSQFKDILDSFSPN